MAGWTIQNKVMVLKGFPSLLYFLFLLFCFSFLLFFGNALWGIIVFRSKGIDFMLCFIVIKEYWIGLRHVGMQSWWYLQRTCSFYQMTDWMTWLDLNDNITSIKRFIFKRKMSIKVKAFHTSVCVSFLSRVELVFEYS